MKKQSKQRIHRNWMQNDMQDLFKRIDLSYYDYGTLKNVGYWFKFDKISNYQHQEILKSHPRPEMLRFSFSMLEYAPEITKRVLILAY